MRACAQTTKEGDYQSIYSNESASVRVSETVEQAQTGRGQGVTSTMTEISINAGARSRWVLIGHFFMENLTLGGRVIVRGRFSDATLAEPTERGNYHHLAWLVYLLRSMGRRTDDLIGFSSIAMPTIGSKYVFGFEYLSKPNAFRGRDDECLSSTSQSPMDANHLSRSCPSLKFVSKRAKE